MGKSIECCNLINNTISLELLHIRRPENKSNIIVYLFPLSCDNVFLYYCWSRAEKGGWFSSITLLIMRQHGSGCAAMATVFHWPSDGTALCVSAIAADLMYVWRMCMCILCWFVWDMARKGERNMQRKNERIIDRQREADVKTAW